MTIDYNEIEIKLPPPPSLNKLYAGRHWSYRVKEKESYYRHIESSLSKYDKWSTERFAIYLSRNHRSDLDNSIVAVKFLADYLRYNGYVVDDTPRYFTELRIVDEKSIEKNTFVAKIICYGFKYAD